MNTHSFKNFCFVWMLLICFGGVAVAQEKVSSFEYQLKRESSENHIVLIWKTNFPAIGSNYRVTARNAMGQATTLDQTTLTPVRVPIVEGTTVTGATFTTVINYGGASNINASTNSLDVSVTPFAGSEASPTLIKTADMAIDMATVNRFFQLETALVTQPPPMIPNLTALTAKVSDDSITVRASSPQFIRVRAFAFATTNAAAVTGDSPFKSDEELLFDNKPKELKIKNLSANTNYVVDVREVGAPSSRSPAHFAVNLGTGGDALKTMETIPRPTVTILSRPVNKKNKSVHLELRSSNAAKITILLEELNSLGETNPSGSPIDITPDASNSPYSRDVAVTLSPDKTYRVKARAFSANADVSPFETPSETFSGKPASLFDIVFLDMTDSDIKFIPKQVNEPVTMSVTAVLSSGTSITVPCAATSPTAPECSFPISAVYNRLTPGAPTGGPGSVPTGLGEGMAALTSLDLPPPAGSKRSTAKFFITVKAADGSEREQNQVFALSLSAPTNPASSSPWKKVVDFGKSLVGVPGVGNKSLDSNQVKPTGFGAVLGMLLKALIL